MCFLHKNNLLYLNKVFKKQLLCNSALNRTYAYKSLNFKNIIKLPRSNNKSLWYFLRKKSYINFFPPLWKPLSGVGILLFCLKTIKTNSITNYLRYNFYNIDYTNLIDSRQNNIVNTSYSTITAVMYKVNSIKILGTRKSCTNDNMIVQFPFKIVVASLNNQISFDFEYKKNINWQLVYFLLYNITNNSLLQKFLFTEFFSLKWIKEISCVLYFFLFLKLKYKGKSYKWFKKKTSIILRFGYSHIIIRQIPNYFFSKKIGKMKLIFFGTSLCDLRSFLSELIYWRPMNIYNGRGLRFARQRVFRKFGKVSAYR